ncbi:MAG: hypothetical protein ACTSVI_09810 [Promethearchaeota archaeon]
MKEKKEELFARLNHVLIYSKIYFFSGLEPWGCAKNNYRSIQEVTTMADK